MSYIDTHHTIPLYKHWSDIYIYYFCSFLSVQPLTSFYVLLLVLLFLGYVLYTLFTFSLILKKKGKTGHDYTLICCIDMLWCPNRTIFLKKGERSIKHPLLQLWWTNYRREYCSLASTGAPLRERHRCKGEVCQIWHCYGWEAGWWHCCSHYLIPGGIRMPG